MPNTISLSARDHALLRLLSRTPATTALILKASESFQGEPFHDERRVRERLQTLGEAQLVRAFPATQGVGGPINWYKLSPEGFRSVHGPDAPLSHRSRFEAIPPSRFMHTQALAEVIVHILVAAHRDRCETPFFQRDGEACIEVGSYSFYPDCFVQFALGAMQFNTYFEIDQSTESLDTHAEQSIRTKLLNYEAYQDSLVAWHTAQRQRDAQQRSTQRHNADQQHHQQKIPRPYFRTVFLTKSQERANNILSLAQSCALNARRHIVYAATQEAFLTEPRPLQQPIFLDHHGHWQSLVNLHPTSLFHRTPVQLARPVVHRTLR